MEAIKKAVSRYKSWENKLQVINPEYYISAANKYPTNTLNEDQRFVFTSISSDLNHAISSYLNNVKSIDSLSFKYKLNDYKNHFSIIYGAAGTGKSYLTGHIVNFLVSIGFNVTVTAPTHKAVAVLKEKVSVPSVFNPPEFRTLHSFLELEMNYDYNNGTVYSKKRGFKNELKPFTDILIIDESSMVNSELFNIILEGLNRGDFAYVLFIGDPNQLPPINDEDFSINDYVSPSKQYKLNQIVRQSEGNPIIEVSQEIVKYITKEKQGKSSLVEFINNSPLKIYSDEYELLKDTIENNNSILLSYTNKNVNLRNTIIRNYKIPEAEEYEFIKGEYVILQQQYTNKIGVKFFNNQEFKIKSVEFRSGANDSNPLFKDLFYYRLYQDIDGSDKNYKTMYIDVISEDSKIVYNKLLSTFATAAKQQANPEKRRKFWKTYFTIKERFCEVQYPFAMTIHKSQGSTFNNVFIDMTGTDFIPDEMYYRLLYVAITRAANTVNLLF